MTRYDYEISKVVSHQDFPFYALMMAAMRQADSANAYLLHKMWPDVWDELEARSNAPGGTLPGD